MLSEHTARAVLQRLAAGQSQREVARAVGIARSTVQRIVRGDGPHADISQAHLEPDPDPDYPGKPFRCPGCGALVTGYCVACGLPPFPVAEAVADVDEEDMAELLGLDLRPRDHARYEYVHALKLGGVSSDLLDGLDEPTDADLVAIEGEIGPGLRVE